MDEKAEYTIAGRGATEAKVRVTVPPAEVKTRLDAIYRRYAAEVSIPGFRRGRIPRHLLDSRFGREVFLAETREELEREHLPAALSELALRPVSPPTIEVVSFDESEPFVFEASFAILPEIESVDYRDLEVSVEPVEPVSDEDIERTLEGVRAEFAVLAEKEGDTVSDGDIVRVRENDHEWDTRVDSENPITRFLIGAKVGSDVDIEAELTDGRKIKTQLHVLGLREVVLPEVDDELAKDAGFESLDALKADIRVKIEEDRAERHRRLVEGKLVDALIERTDIPLPDRFVEDLTEEELSRMKESLERPDSEMPFEEYLAQREIDEDKLREEIRESVSRRLRRELILRRIAQDAGIEIGDEELERIATEDAESIGEDPIRFIARLKAEDRWDDYRFSKTNERVFDLLLESATVKEE